MKIKLFIIFIILLLIVSIIIIFTRCNKIIKHHQDKVSKTIDYYENCIGKSVIINNDTLIIIDYSIWNNTFTLSNGITIHKNIYKE